MASYISANGFRTGSKTPVSILQELLLRNHSVPQYELIHNGVGTHEPQFKYKLQAAGYTAIGTGKSKKEAKHDAARTILKRINANKALTESDNVKPVEEIDIESPYSGALRENIVGQLTDLCFINDLPSPEYNPINEEGPPHARVFTYECKVSSRIEKAVARTKKQAKHMASQQMINRISNILGDKLIPVPEKSSEPDCDEAGDNASLPMIEDAKKNVLHFGKRLSQYHVLPELSPELHPIPILEEMKNKDISWLLDHSSPESLVQELASQLKCEIEVSVVSNGSQSVNDAEGCASSDGDIPSSMQAVMKGNIGVKLSNAITQKLTNEENTNELEEFTDDAREKIINEVTDKITDEVIEKLIDEIKIIFNEVGEKCAVTSKTIDEGEYEITNEMKKNNIEGIDEMTKKGIPIFPNVKQADEAPLIDSNAVFPTKVIMKITGIGTRSFIGSGNSYKEAVCNASLNLLRFYYMCTHSVHAFNLEKLFHNKQ